MPKDKVGKVKKTFRKGKSAWTGLYWPCNANTLIHIDKGFAPQIMKGGKAFFIFCAVCKTRNYFGPAFNERMGMTYEEAERQGFVPLGDRRALQIETLSNTDPDTDEPEKNS